MSTTVLHPLAEARPQPRADWRMIAGVVCVAVVGLALRIYLLTSPVGDLDSDEAIVGLMARRLLDGQFDTFFTGQSYGGSQEAVVSAAVFAVTGSSVTALKMVMVGFTAATAVLTWRVGRRIVGEPAAALAGSLLWLGPPFAVVWSIKARAFYGMSSVCALVAMLAVLRLVDKPSQRDAAMLGVAIGLGWWASPQSVAVAAPVVLWALIRQPALLRNAPAAIGATIVGASPWLLYNLRNDWSSLDTPPLGREAPFTERFTGLFTDAIPGYFGLTDPLSGEWRLGGLTVLLYVLIWAVIAVWAVTALRKQDRRVALVMSFAVFTIYFGANPFTAFPEGRYVWVIAPVLILVLADIVVRAFGAAARPAWVLAVVPLAAISSTFLLVDYVDTASHRVGNWDVRAGDPGPLIDELEERGYSHVHADYWIAYKLSFESRERIIATGTQHVRGFDDHAAVLADPRPAFVAFADTPMAEHIRATFAVHDIPVEHLKVRDWEAYLPLADVPVELRAEIYPPAL